MIYIGTISSVLDEMDYYSYVLTPEIHGFIPDQRVNGVAIPVDGQPVESRGPEEVYVPTI